MGMITAFGFNFAPQGWAQCNGQQIAIQQNTALFALLGTFYGGNGQTTFALPDLRGRSAIGMGAGPGLSSYNIGQAGGAEQTSMTIANMPQHTHAATANSTSTMIVVNTTGDAPNPGNKLLAGSANNPYAPVPTPAPTHTLATQAITTNTTVTNAPMGGSQPISVLSPYLAINYCICVQGIFPSRN